MRILVLGGDGYLGWPTALLLSESGHEVGIADNFVRRQYDHELGVRSLVPIEPLATRVRVWRGGGGRPRPAGGGGPGGAPVPHPQPPRRPPAPPGAAPGRTRA